MTPPRTTDERDPGRAARAAARAAIDDLAAELEPMSPGFAGRVREKADLLGAELEPEVSAAFVAAVRDAGAVEGAGREAGQALLALGPADLGALGARGLAAWSEAVRAIGRHSARAASSFGAAALAALPASPASGIDAVGPAAAAVARLAERHGGDPLVQRFAAAAGAALDARGAAVIEAWAELCEATAFSSRRPVDAATRLPEAAGLADPHFAAAIALAARVARRDRDRGLKIFSAGPQELARLSRGDRSLVLQLLERLAPRAEALLDALEAIGPVLRRVKRPWRWMILHLALDVAERLPDATPRYLRTVLRVGEAIGFGRDLEVFVEKGLALGAEQPAAGLAFFALESRGARAFLRRHDVAVVLEDVEPTLRGYLQLLTRSRPQIAPSEIGGLFPHVPLELGVVPLAARIDVFPTWEENFTLAKLQATLATLWTAQGTRELALAEWLGDDESVGGLPEFYQRFGSPEAAQGLFAHLEAARAMPRLTRLYRGLASDLAGLRRHVFPGDRCPAGHGAPEAILYLALGGSPEAVAWQEPWAAPLRALVDRARDGTGSVYDSADATAALCEQLTAEMIRIYSLESFLEEDPSLSYLLDEGDERPMGGAEHDDAVRPTDELRDATGRRIDEDAPGGSVDRDVLRAYLEQHPDVAVHRAEGPIDPTGLFVTGLTGGGSDKDRRSGSRDAASGDALALQRRGKKAEAVYLHDEWDFVIGDYRHEWCRVHEIALEGDSGEFFTGTLALYSDVLPEVRRQFQRVKPEGYRVIHGLLDGEDFDLDATVTMRSDLRARCTPSAKLYTARKREERDVATLFLLDMSASTDEETEPEPPPEVAEDPPFPPPEVQPRNRSRRIIDIQKEALVIMAQALEEIGDLYAIYGFSGHGRDQVEFFDVKSFDEPLSLAVRGRIGGIEPQRSTRMGAALRQAIQKLRGVTSRAKHLILLSDGFPQDFDYGEDRRSNVYGLRDTMMALREAQAAGVSSFCITVDRAGHDYLREMCDAKRYLVIDDIASLPRELPKIYSEATRGG